MHTRERILYESLKLFAREGFSAVSTRTIARAAGVSDTAIYKHFKSKQEILDTIVEICRARFAAQRSEALGGGICWDRVEEMCLAQFRFQTEDEWIVLFRRILVIEQFGDAKLAALYRSIFVDSAVNGMAALFRTLIDEGWMKPGDPRVYAMELYAPFFMYHTFAPGEDEATLLEALKTHVVYFRKNVQTEKCKTAQEAEK